MTNIIPTLIKKVVKIIGCQGVMGECGVGGYEYVEYRQFLGQWIYSVIS